LFLSVEVLFKSYFCELDKTLPKFSGMLKNKNLSINPYLTGKSQYVLPFQRFGKPLLKLDVIQNYFPPHPSVQEEIRKYNAPHEYSYPDDDYIELLDKISVYCGVKPENIVLTAGSDSGLEILMRALCHGKKVVVPVPTFPQIFLFLELLTSDVERPFVENEHDLELLDLSDAGVCYIVTPNLPLGYAVSPSTVERLALKYPDTWFIVDEAYIEYGGGDSSACLSLENVINTRTFSKAFGLAGMRIGYFIAANNVCELINPLVNNKSVSTLAIKTALAALTHADHYLKIALEVEGIKKNLTGRLHAITGSSLPIYGFLVQEGLFFLLFSKSPQKICDIFADHGIMVRNKQDDYPDSIRICIGPQKMMDDVLSVCEFINVKKLLCGSGDLKPRIAFDLDLTLRDGSTPSAQLYPGASIVSQVDSLIVTNNNSLVSGIVDYFGTYGVEIDANNVVTSISAARKYIMKEGLKPYTLGPLDILGFLSENPYSLDECTCVFLAWINITHRDIVDICHALSQGKPLLYTDMSETCHTSCSSEFGEVAGVPSTIFPDMGLIIQMIKKVDPSFEPLIKCVGKPNMDISCSVLVGDSTSDYQQAVHCGAKFIWIGNENRYNFERRCIEVKNVKYLYDALL